MKRAVALLLALGWGDAPARSVPAEARPPGSADWTDQCSSDPDFADYRRRLERAVRARDPAALRALVSPDIKVDFGGNAGFAAFARAWNLDRPRQSRLWQELAQVMRLGCRREQDLLVMPAYFSALPEGADPSEVMVALRAGAVWPRKAVTGAPIGRFRRGQVLALSGPHPGPGSWVPVRLSPVVDGYVRAADVRSPLDYRALFGREGGRWRLTAFVAGD